MHSVHKSRESYIDYHRRRKVVNIVGAKVQAIWGRGGGGGGGKGTNFSPAVNWSETPASPPSSPPPQSVPNSYISHIENW